MQITRPLPLFKYTVFFNADTPSSFRIPSLPEFTHEVLKTRIIPAVSVQYYRGTAISTTTLRHRQDNRGWILQYLHIVMKPCNKHDSYVIAIRQTDTCILMITLGLMAGQTEQSWQTMPYASLWDSSLYTLYQYSCSYTSANELLFCLET